MRERVNDQEYARRVAESYREVNNLSRNFRNFVNDFIRKAEGERGGAREVILAGVPSFSESQERIIRNYGLYHPNLIYVASR